MAQKFFFHRTKITPDADPKTFWQLLVGANLRVALRFIEIKPIGATSASSPIQFELLKQTTAGTAAPGAFQKESPACGEDIISTIADTFTVEPTASTPAYPMTIHQQGTLIWRPPTSNGLIVMLEAERWGFRLNHGSVPALPIEVCSHFEE